MIDCVWKKGRMAKIYMFKMMSLENKDKDLCKIYFLWNNMDNMYGHLVFVKSWLMNIQYHPFVLLHLALSKVCELS